MKILKLGIALLVMSLCSQAHATVLTFDDITDATTTSLQGTSYGGFTWSSDFYIVNSATEPSLSLTYNGYQNGTVSGDYVAFNAFQNNVSTSNGSAFDFNGGYFTAAWNDDLNITILIHKPLWLIHLDQHILI